MHTPLCKHAEGSPTDYARFAAAIGLPEIGFSDHSPMPSHIDDWRMENVEFPRYLELIEEAKISVPNMTIKLGLEVDYISGGEQWIEALSERAAWDYLIGSVHYLGNWAVDDPGLVHRFGERPVEETWERYWNLFQQAAKSGFFDVMAHPDLVKKFGHRPDGDLNRFYEPAIEAVREAGVAIEINTAGLYKEVHEMYPAPQFLRLAAEADIPLVISSDAHEPNHVGRSFPEAIKLAQECGFKETVRFTGRNRIAVPLGT